MALENNAMPLSLVLVLAFPATLAYALIQIATDEQESADDPAGLRSKIKSTSGHLLSDSITVLANLKEAKRVIKDNQAYPKRALMLASPVLSRLVFTGRQIVQELEQVKRMGRSLANLDATDYATLHERAANLPREVQTDIRKDLASLRQHLAIDQRERELTRAVSDNAAAFAEAMNGIVKSLEKGQTKNALACIQTAQRVESEAQRLSATLADIATRYQQEATRIVVRHSLQSGV
jgi:hypothetical protein